MSNLDFIVKTETAYDGTFTGMAFTRDNSAMRIVARDIANGFNSRSAARTWATRASKAQQALAVKNETERQDAIEALQARRAARGARDPLARLAHHVTGAIEAGEAVPVEELTFQATGAIEAGEAVAVEELTFQATGDETEIFALGDDSARPVALVPFYDGQALQEHQAIVRAFTAAPAMAGLLREINVLLRKGETLHHNSMEAAVLRKMLSRIDA